MLQAEYRDREWVKAATLADLVRWVEEPPEEDRDARVLFRGPVERARFFDVALVRPGNEGTGLHFAVRQSCWRALQAIAGLPGIDLAATDNRENTAFDVAVAIGAPNWVQERLRPQ